MTMAFDVTGEPMLGKPVMPDFIGNMGVAVTAMATHCEA